MFSVWQLHGGTSTASTLSPRVHPSGISVYVSVRLQPVFMFPPWSFLSFHDSKPAAVSGSSPSRFPFDPTLAAYRRLIDAFSCSSSRGSATLPTDWCWHVWPATENNMWQACGGAGAPWQAVQVTPRCVQVRRERLALILDPRSLPFWQRSNKT